MPNIPNKLYKFRSLVTEEDFCRAVDIFKNGFYCNNFIGFNDMNEGVFCMNENNRHINFSSKYKYKICSFSSEEALNSELMWGHYANAGQGIVIEVTLDEDIINSNVIKPVIYSNECVHSSEILEILTHKSEEWKYEHEYRYISTNSLNNNKVQLGKITKIYFGTPYEKLVNYCEIFNNSYLLQQYHKQKEKLQRICFDKEIVTEDFDFRFNRDITNENN